MMPLAERFCRAMLPAAGFMITALPISVSRAFQQYSSIISFTPPEVRREVISADGVRCEWLTPKQSDPQKVLLYLHGGGFVFGFYNAHRMLTGWLAKRAGIRALAVDYRLAPEHPFPAGLDDCVTAYRWLIKQGIAPENIIVGGDSAGANLTPGVLQKLRESGESLPAGIVLISPPTDFFCTGPSFATATDPLLTARAARRFLSLYAANLDLSNPLLSTLYADYTGFPPMLIQAGENEILLSDAERLAEKAKQSGVSVKFTVYPAMWHVWHIFAPFLKQANDAIQEIVEFIHGCYGE